MKKFLFVSLLVLSMFTFTACNSGSSGSGSGPSVSTPAVVDPTPQPEPQPTPQPGQMTSRDLGLTNGVKIDSADGIFDAKNGSKLLSVAGIGTDLLNNDIVPQSYAASYAASVSEASIKKTDAGLALKWDHGGVIEDRTVILAKDSFYTDASKVLTAGYVTESVIQNFVEDKVGTFNGTLTSKDILSLYSKTVGDTGLEYAEFGQWASEHEFKGTLNGDPNAPDASDAWVAWSEFFYAGNNSQIATDIEQNATFKGTAFGQAFNENKNHDSEESQQHSYSLSGQASLQLTKNNLASSTLNLDFTDSGYYKFKVSGLNFSNGITQNNNSATTTVSGKNALGDDSYTLKDNVSIRQSVDGALYGATKDKATEAAGTFQISQDIPIGDNTYSRGIQGAFGVKK